MEKEASYKFKLKSYKKQKKLKTMRIKRRITTQLQIILVKIKLVI